MSRAALLLDALRALRRPGAQWLGPFGLALALAAALLVAWLAHSLASPDPGIHEPERVVVLDFKGNPPGNPTPWFTASPVFFGPALQRMGVPLRQVSRTSESELTLRTASGAPKAFALLVADPDLVPLFGLRALHGNLTATLARRDAVAVTTALVQQLWGALPPAQAVGRTLPLLDGRAFVIGAVMPAWDRRNPQPATEVLAGYDSLANPISVEDREWPFMINGRVYARLGEGAQAADVGAWMRAAMLANPRIKQLPPEWTSGREAAYFRGLPLTELPFAGEAGEQRRSRLHALGAAAALLVLLAAVNGANLRAADLLRRQRETALRRSLGARPAALFALWLVEALGPALLAALAAWLMAWWVAPWLATWLGVWMTDQPPLPLVLGLLALSLLLAPLQLLLPASLALRQPLAPALQGRSGGEGPAGRRLRQGLLVLQLVGALLLLALTGVLMQQHRHLLHADRGYVAENRVVLQGLAGSKPHTELIEALIHLPQVQAWAWGDALPTGSWIDRLEGFRGPAGQELPLRSNQVGPSFFRTWGMRLLAGDPMQGAQGEARVVLDAQAARLLGFASPQAAVGQLLQGGGAFMKAGATSYRVVAVVADLRFEAGRLPSQPKLFHLKEGPFQLLTLQGRDIAALEQAVHDTWQRLRPALLRGVERASEQRAQAYSEERRLTGLLAVVAGLALVVALLGAQALVADTLRRRRREIVLHRLHGAGRLAIATRLLRELATPLALSLLLAPPLAAWLGWQHLQQYADRVALLPGLSVPIAAACALLLPVLLLTLAQQICEALALQPVEALQDN
ncbi:FtsX-like permease family protein [Inhella sp.]|uniref:FtsX-like permease family protein n=1 Tax=Inhella sp. TaxID=1921806 RepID=UPI0035B02D3D